MQTRKETMKLEKMITDVKRECMYYLISHMRRSKLSVQEARVLSKDILAMSQVASVDDLLAKLKHISVQYPIIREVFIKYAKQKEEEQKEYVLQNIPAYLQAGDVENALNILKGGIFYG